MSASNCKLCLNVAISKDKSNVLFAEAEGDLVNILVSFLNLPLANIVTILDKYYAAGDAPTIASLTTLYRSSRHLQGKTVHKILHNSFQAQASVESSATFIILDDLRVVPVVSGFLQTLKTLGVKEFERADITTVYIDDDDVMDLLKFCLSSASPLTDLMHKKSEKRFTAAQQESRFAFLHFSYGSSEEKMVLKILLQKSTGRFLLAEASDDFVNYLLSVLNASLGGVVFALDENPFFKNLKNLNHSARYVLDDKYFKGGDAKRKLWDLQRQDSVRLILAFKPEGGSNKYIVRDDLSLEPSSLTSTFSILNSLGVLLSDVKEMDFGIGLNEALNIVAASLSSTTVFTDVLINRKPKNSSKRLKVEQ